MRILVVSFYFRPDLSAGSFRATAFVDELRQRLPAGSAIDVLTTLPNRYDTFSIDAPQQENHEGLSIHRIPLPAHRSGMLDQSRSFASFFWRALKYSATRDYDAIFATSSRLMTAVLAAWISKVRKIPLYLDIRDIFVDTIKDVFPFYLAKSAGPVFGIMERWAVNKAISVNLVSPGFSDYFSSRYPGKKFSFFTNGIDDEFITVACKSDKIVSAERDAIRVLYAGNIGDGQGLHEIVPRLADRMSDRLVFRILGDGGRKEELLSRLSRRGIDNVEVLPPVNRDQLIREYKDADVLFLHLNDHDAFKKVLPSKIFEYGAMGKPIWAGVAGYAAGFLQSEVSNVAVFKPCDANDAERVFSTLVLKDTARNEFIVKYARKNIMQQMVRDFMDMIARE